MDKLNKEDMIREFKKDFLWGASTSAYQVEGAAKDEGKGLSVQDVKEVPEGTLGFDVSVDHYHKYEEDIALMAEMGLKAYRFSIAWTRILPEGRRHINQKGLDHYHHVIDTCIKHGIEPVVTLYHFDLPYALETDGGWSNRRTIDAFVEYAKLLFEHYGEKVKYWLTINEQNMMILHGQILGTDFDEIGNRMKKVYTQNHHMFLAQARTMKLCHEMLPDALIGPAPNFSNVYPATCKPEDYLAAQNFSAVRNWLYYDMAVYGRYNPIAWNYLEKNDCTPTILPGDMDILKNANPDFLALNYYSSTTIKYLELNKTAKTTGDQQTAISEPGWFGVYDSPYLEKTKFGWDIDAPGFRITLKSVYARYELPILVTENGLGLYESMDKDGQIIDNDRIDFLSKHIYQAKLAVDEGVDLIGYCPWSAIDLISTHQGIRKRYGFIYIDLDDEQHGTMKRYKKKSFYWYQKLIKKNGEIY